MIAAPVAAPQATNSRTMRSTLLTAGIGGASILTILIVALLVGGSLTQPPTAVAVGAPAPKGAAVATDEDKYGGFQLPTLGLND